MEVILLERIRNLGKVGDQVNVNALNNIVTQPPVGEPLVVWVLCVCVFVCFRVFR